MIFEKADDYLTDPEGEAGARIACGTLGAGEVSGRGVKHGLFPLRVRWHGSDRVERHRHGPAAATGELPPSHEHDRTAMLVSVFAP